MTTVEKFETLVRSAALFTQEPLEAAEYPHPFEQRNVSSKIPEKVRKLFDDAHYAQATFEAMKFLDRSVARLASTKKTGAKLMQEAFKDISPAIQINGLTTESEIDEQRGYQWLFTGSIWAIRNPRGHEFDVKDDPDLCLDHLVFISMLIRRLEKASFKF